MLQFPLFEDIDELNNFLPTLPPNDASQSLNKLEDDVIHHKPHMLCKSI